MTEERLQEIERKLSKDTKGRPDADASYWVENDGCAELKDSTHTIAELEPSDVRALIAEVLRLRERYESPPEVRLAHCFPEGSEPNPDHTPL